MARLARVVAPGMPHHITQRGNRRQATFLCDEDYAAYLELMSPWCGEHGVQIWAYCLMPNHVHLIAVPKTRDGLTRAIGEAHRRYAWRVNFREGWRGHLWQGRFASFMIGKEARACPTPSETRSQETSSEIITYGVRNFPRGTPRAGRSVAPVPRCRPGRRRGYGGQWLSPGAMWSWHYPPLVTWVAAKANAKLSGTSKTAVAPAQTTMNANANRRDFVDSARPDRVEVPPPNHLAAFSGY